VIRPRPVRRRPLQLGLAGALGVGAAVLVSCGGSSKLIPAQNATQLKADFDAVAAAVASGGCNQDLKTIVAQTRRDLASLPPTLDPSLARTLGSGVNTLASRATVECKSQTTQTTPTNTNTSPTTNTNTAPTTNTTTTTTPTTPTTTSTTPTTPTDTTPTTPTDTGPATTPTTVPNIGGGTPAPNGQSGQVRLGGGAGSSGAGGTFGGGTGN
jgi:hypothetical protein